MPDMRIFVKSWNFFLSTRLYHGNFLQPGIMPGTPVFPCFSRVFLIALDNGWITVG